MSASARGNADRAYDHIAACLEQREFRPRALFERFNIEAITTTDSPLDDLRHHRKIRSSGWRGRVLTAFRPDPVVDPAFPRFVENLAELGRIADCDVSTYDGYLSALAKRRAYFKSIGCTSTDHGHPTARTADLPKGEAAALYARVRNGGASAADAELFRAQMLTEMARMSLEDGLVMQIHPGSVRDHNPAIFRVFGRDKGCDIPSPTDYVFALKPLLDRFGNERDLTIILFTLDETAFSRELAPLAGHYPALKLGPALVVLRQPRGHAALPRDRHRDGGLLQHGRLQRRHARVSVDPGAARHEPARRLRLSRPPRRRAPARTRRGVRSRSRSRLQARQVRIQTLTPPDGIRLPSLRAPGPFPRGSHQEEGTMPFQPVDNRRLYEQVADQIGGLVRKGEFLPGQRLPAERDLAKMLAVSRPVVREAMIALEIGGLIEVRTGSGAFVREKPAEAAGTVNIGHSPSDILNARMLIEGETAALSASRATPEDVAVHCGMG